MVDRKGAPPPVQRTLLSFFKPKTDATAPPSNTTAKLTSPSSASKRKGLQDTSDNDSSPGSPLPRKKRTLHGKEKEHGETIEESLFPANFSSEIRHVANAPLSQPSTLNASMEMSIDAEQPTEPVAEIKKFPSRGLSRFGYQAADQGILDSMDVDQQEVKDERRDRFRKKLGGVATEPTHDTTLRTPTPGRRRLIISESDEEDTVNGPDPEDTLELDGGNRGIRPRPEKAQGQPSTKASATSSRVSASRKAVKSPYTPLEKQFVEIKEQYPDAILCIEVGYKFRFFGEDAEIASRELSIAHFMDHNFYTASIPIHRLNVHVRRLVHAGYKVGVVRQMETAALKSAGDNKSAPFTRKLTNLYTKATFLESLDQDEEQFQGSFVGKGPSSQYLMCIHEQPQGGSGADEKVKIAILAVQPATGDIIYDEFLDGHFRNELETRLLHIQPTELIVPMEPLSKATEKLISYLTGSSHGRMGSVSRSQDDVRIERTEGFAQYDKAFTLVSEFYTSSLKEEKLKKTHQNNEFRLSKQSQMEALLKTVLGLSRNLIIALSAMITHLSDFGLAPVFRLSKYFECFTSRSHMLLNGNTISNLEIYRNQTDWTTRGSLFGILDHTATGFGRRLLKKWVGKPLVDRKALQERVDAVEEILALAGNNIFLQSAQSTLKGLMDLEKGVCRIHYGKSSPKEFLSILRTFMRVSGIIPVGKQSEMHPEFGLKSPMLQRLLGSLSNATDDCKYFLDGLDEQAAGKDDKLQMFQDDIIEEKWPEILEHRRNIVRTEDNLLTHLGEVRKILREPRLEFNTVSGIEHLIEVKNKDVAKIPKSWIKISGTKQVSRFHTPEAIQLIQAKAQHQERLVLACDQAFASFQQEFSERYEVFRDVVQNLAVLDCLFSLSIVACLPGYVKPEYVDDEVCDLQTARAEDDSGSMDRIPSTLSRTAPARTTIDITNGRHPMVEQMLPSGNFVPNNVHFGTCASSGVEGKTMILTGPNMGGKSCYIRQVALLCIMAQIGSYLPADSARVSLLDAVFTRMGASDNIFGHESTFMVELQETSDILRMASSRSLVILDELGRGTSTLDGVAIAYAVLKYVVSHIGATTLFVTHYPSLADVAKEYPEDTVRNYHMGFMASSSGSGSGAIVAKEVDLAMEEPGSTANTTLEDMDIVFLYKLVPGVSLKSYGLNVARMAKLPLSLIARAKTKSKELEAILERRLESRRQERRL
ncbi:Mismatch repair protein msh3, partial [Dissophora ornata]